MRHVVLACRVMQIELDCLCRTECGVEVRYLDQSLHRTPKDMPQLVQAEIDAVAGYAPSITLGYGLCSNGIVGVTARRQGLIVPKGHDCITLFLGSLAAYHREFLEKPGTYYLTPGWIDERKDPLGILQEEYVPKLGEEMALWVMAEELKHYTHIALINTGLVDADPLRERARENARFFGKEYKEIEGSLGYFRDIVRGVCDPEKFFFIQPGESITQEMFLDMP